MLVAWTSDGSRVATSFTGIGVEIRERTGAVVAIYALGLQVYCVWWTPDNQRLLVATRLGYLVMYDATAHMVWARSSLARISRITFNPEGDLMLLARASHGNTIQRVADGAFGRRYAAKRDDPLDVAWGRHEALVVATHSNDPRPFIRGLSSNRKRWLEHPGADRATISPDQTMVATASPTTVSVWRLDDVSLVCSVDGCEDSSLSWSADSRFLAVAGDGVVRIWHVASNRIVGILRLGRGGRADFVSLPTSLALITPDGALRLMRFDRVVTRQRVLLWMIGLRGRGRISQ